MKIYFLQKDQQFLGPYSLDEVRDQPIAEDMLVWKDGTADWVKAIQLEELASMFGLSCPSPETHSSPSPGNFWLELFSKWPGFHFPVFAR